METSQETATKEQIDEWLRDQPEFEFIRHQTGFAAMAYLGLCRHQCMSPDWIAHSHLWTASEKTLAEMFANQSETNGIKEAQVITNRISRTFKNLGFYTNCQF